MKQTIMDKLASAFSPTLLNLIDESEQHRGHGGWREGGETHFRVQIASPSFAGMSRVAQHRAINEQLADEFAAGVHALAIEVKSGS